MLLSHGNEKAAVLLTKVSSPPFDTHPPNSAQTLSIDALKKGADCVRNWPPLWHTQEAFCI